MIPRLMLMALAGKAVDGGEEEEGPTYYGELYKAIMDDSPLAYWRLGEAAGTDALDEVGSFDGTYVNTPTLDVAGALGNDLDTAVDFSGSSECVNMGSVLDFERTDPFSLECWFKQTPHSNQRVFISKEDTGSPYNGYKVYQLNGVIWVMIQSTGSIYLYTVADTFDDGNWHHLIVTYDGSSNVTGLTMYIDGKEEPTTTGGTTVSGSTINDGVFSVAARDAANWWFYGSIDDVAVYDTELTAVRVARHYWAGMSAYADSVMSLNPVGYWRLGESSGTDCIDELGINDGTYVNTPTLGVTGPLTGDSDTAVSFASASTEHVVVGDVLDFDYDEPFSLECWYKPDGSPGSYLISKHLLSGDITGYGIFYASDGYIDFYHRSTPSNLIRTVTAATYASSVWRHLVVTYDGSADGSGVTFYVNGVAIAINVINNTLTTTTLNSADFRLAGSGSVAKFNGSMDEVAVYDKELSAAEVRKNYWAGQGHRRYSLAVIGDGPLSYWRLGEAGAATTAVDFMGANDGTYVNTPTLEVAGPLVDDSDTAVTFTAASSEHVTMGDVLDFERTDTFSIECWFKTSATGVIRTLVSKRLTSGDLTGWTIYQYSSTDALRFVLYSSVGNYLAVETTSTYNDGNWHHLTTTYDGSSSASGVTIYIDGSLAEVFSPLDNLTSSTVGTAPLQIGANDGANNLWDGSIDEVSVYDYELTVEQIAKHFHEGLSSQA